MTGGDVGHDKEGSVLRIEPWGYLDMKGIMYSCKKSDLEKSKLLQCEKHLKDLEATSEKVRNNLVFILQRTHTHTHTHTRKDFSVYLHEQNASAYI